MLCKIAVIVSLLCTGCAPRMARRDFHIIKETPQYAIGQEGNNYLIFAKSAHDALEIADSELKCKKEPCAITPRGIVLQIEKIEQE